MDTKSRRPPKHILLAFCAIIALFYLFRIRPRHQTFAQVNSIVDCCEATHDKPEGLGQAGHSWAGWQTVENMFIFGDSYSDTGFDVVGEQPSEEKPMGNSPFYWEHTGPRWPMLLTETYNDSAIKTYCFATSGASVDKTIDNNVVPPDFVEQVERIFIPSFVKDNSEESSWKPETSLFVVFFGINDNRLLEMMPGSRTSETQRRMLERYSDMLQTLYDNGARNIMIVNVPPMGRSPSGTNKISRFIATWNQALSEMAITTTRMLRGAKILEFDAFDFFNRGLDDPTVYQQTSHIKITDDRCAAYDEEWKRAVEIDAFDEDCGIALKDYFWWDALHPTPSVQDALAEQIAEYLRHGKVANTANATSVTHKSHRQSGHRFED
ncbi:uncharacterized protein KY384_006182 [Bacidia gigantensis]|uniref:uncharacterized protein n=1 Tax=Bacidia gigantensis TaxID=2732470 RepID=UPI001D03A13D|nr:uncharacterized protein KY384_006182 [Bacidia gigantensis]KAG8529545.1 hypothetical protein KY384_006182 [Bacidia gigantensis]